MTDRSKLKEKFPAKAYKQVNFGRGFTSIDAYYVIERLNDVFGLDGWIVEVDEWVVSGNSVACIGRLTAGKIVRQAVGDGTIIKGNQAEAYKKAFTNLISKAASYIEIGLDVYQGTHDSDPYLDKEYLQSQSSRQVSDKKNKQYRDFSAGHPGYESDPATNPDIDF